METQVVHGVEVSAISTTSQTGTVRLCRLKGLMEFAGVDKAARSKMGGVENAGVDKSARYGKGGHCGNGQCGAIWQGWTLQEWTNQHDVARVDIAGVKKRVQVSLTETVLYYT